MAISLLPPRSRRWQERRPGCYEIRHAGTLRPRPDGGGGPGFDGRQAIPTWWLRCWLPGASARPEAAAAFLDRERQSVHSPLVDEGHGQGGGADQTGPSARRREASPSSATTTWTASPPPVCSPTTCAAGAAGLHPLYPPTGSRTATAWAGRPCALSGARG